MTGQSKQSAREYSLMYGDDEQRSDYAEEAYWNNYCANCDSSPCRDPEECLKEVPEDDECGFRRLSADVLDVHWHAE
jgi:hypothetical protein